MDAFQVRFLGSKALLAKIGKLEGFTRSPRLLAIFKDAGEAYVLRARAAAPKASRMLVSALGHQVRNFGTPHISLKVGFDERASRWASYIEFGSGPSVRVPRLKRWMHWFSAGQGGKTIQQPYGLQGQGAYYSNFRSWVKHPGTKPQPFFLKHLHSIRNTLVREIKRAIDEELRASKGP